MDSSNSGWNVSFRVSPAIDMPFPYDSPEDSLESQAIHPSLPEPWTPDWSRIVEYWKWISYIPLKARSAFWIWLYSPKIRGASISLLLCGLFSKYHGMRQVAQISLLLTAQIERGAICGFRSIFSVSWQNSGTIWDDNQEEALCKRAKEGASSGIVEAQSEEIRVRILVVPTDEEREIARQTRRLLLSTDGGSRCP
jgi:hypothetical protein